MSNYGISEYILLPDILYTLISTKEIDSSFYNCYIKIIYNFVLYSIMFIFMYTDKDWLDWH